MSDIFGQSNITKAVHDTLEAAYAAIPPGKSHALLVDASTESGVRALYVQRMPEGWNVALQGDWHGGDHVAGRIALLKAW